MRTHPVSVSHLVVGLVYLGLTLAWALGELGVIGVGSLEWVLPATLIAAGATGVLASAVKAVRRRSQPAESMSPAWTPTWDAPAEPGWGPVSSAALSEPVPSGAQAARYPWVAPDPEPSARTFVAGPRAGGETAAGTRPAVTGDTGDTSDTGDASDPGNDGDDGDDGDDRRSPTT